MSPSHGTFETVSWYSSLSSPPITTVSPSRIVTTFSISRFESGTPTSAALPSAPLAVRPTLIAVISWKISIRRLSPSVICGVTRNVTPMSWRSTLTEVARLPVALVTPCADCTRFVMIGMF